MTISELEIEIAKIHERNTKVETDKAWETSYFRKISIAILTYMVIALFFYSANLSRPLLNAIVPTAGFILSTLSLSFLKSIWLKYFQKHN